MVPEFAGAAIMKHHDWVACTTGIYFLTALETRSLRPRCPQGWLLHRPLALASPGLHPPRLHVIFPWAYQCANPFF